MWTDEQTGGQKERRTDKLKFATNVPKNVSQCHSFLHKSDMEWSGIESELLRRKAGDY
jgi:hypothetical protein